MPPVMESDYSSWEGDGRTSNIGFVRNGNSADNKLGGTNKKDAFFAGKGNDVLGGYGDFDTYMFELGDGADVIVDLSPSGNLIRFRDVPENTIRISEIPGFAGETDRLIEYGETDAIRVVGWSRLSDETKSAWKIEFLFLPKPEPVPERRSPLLMLLSDPKSLLLIVLLLGVGLTPLVRILLKKRQH